MNTTGSVQLTLPNPPWQRKADECQAPREQTESGKVLQSLLLLDVMVIVGEMCRRVTNRREQAGPQGRVARGNRTPGPPRNGA